MTIKIGLVVLSVFFSYVVAFAQTTIDRDINDPSDPRTQWTQSGSPYIIAPAGDFIYIGNNVTLTIQAGVTVKFNSGKSLVITNGATLRADGTSNPITFTSNTASPPPDPFWQGLRVDGGSASILINCNIEYAVYGLSIPNESTAVKVSGCTFRSNATPIKVHPDSVRPILVGPGPTGIESNNTFDSNRNPYIEVLSGYMKRDANWLRPTSPTPTVPYLITGDVTIANQSGRPNVVTLMIGPGARLQFMPATGMVVGSFGDFYAGILKAQGNSSSSGRIEFTRYGTGGNWKGIRMDFGANNRVVLSYCDLSYSGAAWYDNLQASLSIQGSGANSVTYCTVKNGNGSGIKIGRESCNVIVYGCTIENNSDYGIYIDNESSAPPAPLRPQIVCSQITGNTQGGIYVKTASPVINHCNLTNSGVAIKYENPYPAGNALNARANWWGAAPPPATATSVIGNGTVDTLAYRNAAMNDLNLCLQQLPRWKRDYIYANGQLVATEERSPP